MKYTNLSDIILDGKGRSLTESVSFLNCHNVVFKNWIIVGGSTNLMMQECTKCLITGVVVSDAQGPADPYGHGIQLNACKRCTVCDCIVNRGVASEDGCNDYKGLGNLWMKNMVRGHGKSKSGNCITIDRGTQLAVVESNVVDAKGGYGGIVVAAGNGHKITNNTISNCGCGVTVRNCYSPAKTVDVVVSGNRITKFSDSEYWIDKKTTANVVVIK